MRQDEGVRHIAGHGRAHNDDGERVPDEAVGFWPVPPEQEACPGEAQLRSGESTQPAREGRISSGPEQRAEGCLLASKRQHCAALFFAERRAEWAT